MKKIVGIIFLSLSILSAKEIQIAVAANVSYAIKDLKKAFHKKYPKTQVNVILGSSGKLTAQIKFGAPYGLFMSANMKYPNMLYKEKIAKTKPVVYAQGALALWSVKKQDYTKGISVLKNADIHKIAIANPKTAPYGEAAKELLENVKLYSVLKEKFVYGESISQTISYTSTVADIGLIAKSALFSPQMSRYKKNIHWSDINASSYTPINQGMVILKESEEIRAFYDFILSSEAKEILKKFGYTI